MAHGYTRFLKFQRDQGGILPVNLAADYLGITRQALNVALTRKKVDAIRHGRAHYYGLKSLRQYKEFRTALEGFRRNFNKDVTP